MAKPGTLTTVRSAGFVTVTVAGALNESTWFPNIDSDVEAVVFELRDFIAISSFAVRGFKSWLKQVTNPKLIFRECPPPFIFQVNTVFEFLPARAQIETFYVPYYNEISGEELLVRFRHGKEFFEDGSGQTQLVLPQIFDSQGNEMGLDVDPPRYFQFLNKPRNKTSA